MKTLYMYALIMILLQTHVIGEELCGGNITGAVGGAVTLHVGHTEAKIITWSFGEKRDPIAVVILGVALEEQDVRYEGRLSSTSDGSLTIHELKQEDRGPYRAQIGKQSCNYSLTLFNNLTAENIDITHNVTGNGTCEVTLTCSVNGSDVTTNWTSANVSNIDRTQNVVFVPPSHINFTYTCTARNLVSEASKVVHPREYCKGDTTHGNGQRNREILIWAFVSFFVICIFVVIITVIGMKWYKRGNKEQKPEKERRKKNEKEKKESPKCSASTVYSQINHPVRPQQQGKMKSKEDAVTTLYSTVQNTKGTSGKSNSSKASNQDVPRILAESCYEKVQLPKSTNDQKTSPKGANGYPPKAEMESVYDKVQLPEGNSGQKISPKSPKTTQALQKPSPKVGMPPKENGGQMIQPKRVNANPPEDVQIPSRNVGNPAKSTNDKKTSPKGANGYPPKAEMESVYDKVQLPEGNSGQKISPKSPKTPQAVQNPSPKVGMLPESTNDQKISPNGANGFPTKAEVESVYDKVQLTEENSGQKILPRSPKTPQGLQNPSPKVGKPPEENGDQKIPLESVHAKQPEAAQKPSRKVGNPPKQPAEASKDGESMYDNVQGVQDIGVKSRTGHDEMSADWEQV